MSRKRNTTESLNRRGWALWALTFCVLVALATAVPLLYFPLLEMANRGTDVEGIAEPYYAIIGLMGLVLVFCLYTALKQRELNQTRKQLAIEENETEDARNRLAELSALFQMSTSLNLQLRLEVILEIIVRRVVSSLKAQQASIMIYNPESGDLETRATYGLESEFARNAKKKMGEGIAGWVAQRNESVMLNNTNSESHELGRHFKSDRNITSALSLPLRVGERCVGVLNVNRINHPEPFQEHHREMLNLFAEHVGAVVDRADMMDRLGKRSRELEADNQKLAETNRMKDVFLSTASHELKTPLTSVIAYAELLDDNEGTLGKDQRREFLRRLRVEAERLLGLIDDILDLSRIESGKLTLRRVAISPNEIAHAAVETTRSIGKKRGVELIEKLDPGLPEIALDEVKMRQVVVNLLVNAVKFSPEKSKVTIVTAREPRFVLIEVRDNGPGIRPEEATHIFELFGQGVPGKEEQNNVGLGIGLHLVKRITELHGGHVGVNSTKGEGSSFWVRLPLIAAEEVTGTGEEPAVAA